MVDLLELLVFLVVGIAGLVQWLLQRKRATRRKPARPKPSPQPRHTAVHPARSAPTPSSHPARTYPEPSPQPAQLPEFTEPASPSLEDILSELFGGEPVSIPPRPPMRVPPRPRKTKTVPTPSLTQPAEQPVPTSATPPPPPPSPPPTPHPSEPTPSPPSPLATTLHNLHAADWQLAFILHEILSPPLSLR